MQDRFLTISVDDGDQTDFRTAELLTKHGLQATFYIPATNPERPVISKSQVRELSRNFEIGAHTASHVRLDVMSDAKAWEEIVGGKKWLEDATGKPAPSFCYPQGKFNGSTAAMVRRAGFVGARTCYYNLHTFPRDPFRWGVSTQATSHSKVIQVRHALLERNFEGLMNFALIYKGATDWQRHFMQSVLHVEQQGGIAHLFLHSWEVDQHDEWHQLESIFAVISTRKNFRRVTNGELFQLWTEDQHGHA